MSQCIVTRLVSSSALDLTHADRQWFEPRPTLLLFIRTIVQLSVHCTDSNSIFLIVFLHSPCLDGNDMNVGKGSLMYDGKATESRFIEQTLFSFSVLLFGSYQYAFNTL